MSTRMNGEENAGGEVHPEEIRIGGSPRTDTNRKYLCEQLGISELELAIPVQCHSHTVLHATAPGEYKDCDALITNTKRVAVSVATADCVPIMVYDPVHRSIGAVHAGWRGTADEIVRHTVEKMKVDFKSDPSDLIVSIGPSAGVCCYEVGDEVAVMFKNKMVSSKKGKMFIDLKEENKRQLQQLGVASNNIEVSSFCTICNGRLFHSFRRDGRNAGRMTAVICIVE